MGKGTLNCLHLRKRVESPSEAVERWERGEDPMWYEATCTECLAIFFVPSDRQLEKKYEEQMEEHLASSQQVLASGRSKSRAKRLRVSRRRGQG